MYKWYHADNLSSPVFASASPQYMLSATDVGKSFAVQVEFTDDLGNLEKSEVLG